MTREELKEYLAAQVAEIEKYKWVESERHQRDIGFNRAALEWIDQYGEIFYRNWCTRKVPAHHD